MFCCEHFGKTSIKAAVGRIGRSWVLEQSRKEVFSSVLMLFGEFALLQTSYSSISGRYFKLIQSIWP